MKPCIDSWYYICNQLPWIAISPISPHKWTSRKSLSQWSRNSTYSVSRSPFATTSNPPTNQSPAASSPFYWSSSSSASSQPPFFAPSTRSTSTSTSVAKIPKVQTISPPLSKIPSCSPSASMVWTWTQVKDILMFICSKGIIMRRGSFVSPFNWYSATVSSGRPGGMGRHLIDWDWVNGCVRHKELTCNYKVSSPPKASNSTRSPSPNATAL